MRAGHRHLKPLVVILGLLLTGACAGRDDPEYPFDFSGIDPFWDVHDTLAADAEPSDSLWEAPYGTRRGTRSWSGWSGGGPPSVTGFAWLVAKFGNAIVGKSVAAVLAAVAPRMNPPLVYRLGGAVKLSRLQEGFDGTPRGLPRYDRK